MVAGVGAQYAAAALVFFFTDRPWMAVMYVGYTVGNIGAWGLAMGYK